MVYPKNVSILTAPGFKVKLIIHHRPVSTATNRSLLAHRYNFVGNSSGNKEFLPEPPVSSDSIDVNHQRDDEFF